MSECARDASGPLKNKVRKCCMLFGVIEYVLDWIYFFACIVLMLIAMRRCVFVFGAVASRRVRVAHRCICIYTYIEYIACKVRTQVTHAHTIHRRRR